MDKARVLIVDDDDKILKMFRHSLGGEGVCVDTASSGPEAIEKVRASRYDLVFIDVIMPGLNGVESLEKIREFDPAVKVVMITGFAVAELLERARRRGAYASLSKPINLQQMVKVIEEVKADNPEAQKRCLVIDQKDSIDTAFYGILEAAHFDLRVVPTWEAAIGDPPVPQYDLLVFNLDFNRMDPCELLNRAGSSFPKGRIVLLLDTEEEEEIVEKALQKGAARYLRRSATREEILALLNEVLEGAMERRAP